MIMPIWHVDDQVVSGSFRPEGKSYKQIEPESLQILRLGPQETWGASETTVRYHSERSLITPKGAGTAP